MPYQFRQTGAEIQDILDQVGENTGDIAQNTQDISTLNSNLTQLSTTYTYTHTDSTTGITIKAKKRGGILEIQLSGSATVPNTWTVIGTLPEELRPSSNLPYTTLVSQNASTAKLLLSVYADGTVRVNASGGTLSAVYFNDAATFVAD